MLVISVNTATCSGVEYRKTALPNIIQVQIIAFGFGFQYVAWKHPSVLIGPTLKLHCL